MGSAYRPWALYMYNVYVRLENIHIYYIYSPTVHTRNTHIYIYMVWYGVDRKH